MAKKNEEPWRCLSIHQPWAWAIITGAKDVENRDWLSNYTGRLHIHAARTERDDSDAVHLSVTGGANRRKGVPFRAPPAPRRRRRDPRPARRV